MFAVQMIDSPGACTSGNRLRVFAHEIMLVFRERATPSDMGCSSATSGDLRSAFITHISWSCSRV